MGGVRSAAARDGDLPQGSERLVRIPDAVVDSDPVSERAVVAIAAPARETVRESYRRLYRRVALTDIAAIWFAMLLAYWARFGVEVPTTDFLWLLLATPLVVTGVFALFHLYEAFRFGAAEEFRQIVIAVTIGLAGLMVLSFWSKAEISRFWVGVAWALALVLTLSARRVWHHSFGVRRARGELTFRTVIVGTNDEARALAETLSRGSFGFEPIGFIRTAAPDADTPATLPILADLEDLTSVIQRTRAECVFVASSSVTPGELKPVTKAVRLAGVEVRLTASLPEVLTSRLTVQPLGGVMTMSLRPARLTGGQAVAKFAFDLVLSSALLIVLSPLLLGVAVAVKLSSSGPVLHRQDRVGIAGRRFTMLKFRTMRKGAEDEVDALRAEHGVDGLMFKLRDDPRVTKVGRWLRRYSIDELPQLLNVVRGDMSLVGPRPALPSEVARYEDWHMDRLAAPPGITGLWQVSGRSTLSFDDCVRLDIFYIENWSLVYDLYILARTIPDLVTARGAF